MPVLSLSLKADFRVVSDVLDVRIVFWLRASDENKIKEAERARNDNSRIFLYEIPDPNTDKIQNYMFLSALLIISSTVRF